MEISISDDQNLLDYGEMTMLIEYDEKEIEVSPIVGAIGWPSGGKPGYAAVIGRSPLPRVASQMYDYYLVAEVEEATGTALIDRCVKLTRRFSGLEFINKYNPDHARLIDAWNEGRHGHEFCVYPALYSDSDSISYPVENLIGLAKQKCLHGFDETKAIEYLNAFHTHEIPEATCAKYPAIAALGYAVLFLKNAGIDDYQEESYEPATTANPITGH